MTKKKEPAEKKATAVKKPTTKKTAPPKEDGTRGRGRRANPKAGTERWLYKPIKEEVAILIEKKQPFILVKYPIWAKFISGRKEYGYELVLIQTKDREDPLDLLTMTKETFNDLIEQHGMQQLYRDSNGACYGIDTRLRELHEKLRKLREKPESHIRELRAIWINNNYPKVIREKVAEAIDLYRKMLDKSLSEFYKKNEIIIWDFGTLRENEDDDPDDEDETDE